MNWTIYMIECVTAVVLFTGAIMILAYMAEHDSNKVCAFTQTEL